ncbi:hypothetical protein COP2_008554 [Malus domestica]
MKLHSLKVLVRHVFFVLLATCVLVLACLLVGIIKHIEHNAQAYNVLPTSPQIRSISLVLKDCEVAFILLIVMIGIMGFFIFSYIYVMHSSGRREMHLCNTLIKQMEATQQAERKSMNKSLAFATASHDIRAALAGITGLIEISKEEVSPGSELETNLRQMETCARDLFGILNSILDTSKIEAGKIQLEEEEFDVAQLVEDVVDLYHPVGLKKGIDVVLDPHDGSLIKFPCAVGDRGRLKQILCNLISNAVKFTSEGHVTVRAWVEKPSFKNSIAASGKGNGVARQLLYLFNHNKKAQADMGTMKHDPNALEFVFEVDDTGKGIPKEKQKSVFENYVQVKETALGEGGTGLGLGIVQSLVRLMHGEIGIVDKEMGERGTCFRFSVLLTLRENVSKDSTKEVDIEMGFGPGDLGILVTHTPSTPGLSIHTPSPRLNIRTPCSTPKVDGSGSSVVLLIKNEERRRISQKFMENLGIKVFVAEQWEQLSQTLEKVTKHKGGYHSRHHSSSRISEVGLQECLSKSTSCNSSNRVNEVPLISAMDGSGTENNSSSNNMLPLSLFKKTSLRGATGFVLVVVDATAGPFSELCKIVTEFKTDHHQNSTRNCNWCRVVWLASHSINLNDRDMFDPEDVIKHKALHGSRLYEVVRLLPEFGGALPKRRATIQQLPHQVGKASRAPASSSISHQHRSYNYQFDHSTDDEIEVSQDHSNIGGSSGNETPRKKIFSPTLTHQYLSHVGSSTSRNSQILVPPRDQTQEHVSNPNRPLIGKKFLVADDIELNRKLAQINLTRLGATVELCGNGREALDLVRGALANQGKHGFDYILMDCEMPEMDGFEATRQIRREEEPYNLHIPIIALTGHASGEERSRRMEAGMDDHLSKPFQREQLLEKTRRIDDRNKLKEKC